MFDYFAGLALKRLSFSSCTNRWNLSCCSPLVKIYCSNNKVLNVLRLPRLITNSNTVKLWIGDTYGSTKMCSLLRGVCYWEVISKRLSYLGLNILSAIQGMSDIRDVRYWDVSPYYFLLVFLLKRRFLKFS